MKYRTAIFAAVLLAVLQAAVAADAQTDQICGSAAKFAQTKRWEDLPGCAKYQSYDEANRADMILARTKRKFQEFFKDWVYNEEFGNENTGFTYMYRNELKNFVEEGDEAAWQNAAKLREAKPAFEEMVRVVEKYMAMKNVYPLIAELGSSFRSTKYRTRTLEKDAGKDSEFAAVYLKSLREHLDKVIAAGVPDDTLITSFEEKTYTLADIKTETAQLAGSQKDLGDKFRAAEEEKWRPFKSVLKGDRLAHFDRYKDSYEFRGVGGRILRTPADFRTTPIMAVLSVDDNGVLNRWSVTIWRFAGDKLVGKQTKTGWGSTAPSSAYK